MKPASFLFRHFFAIALFVVLPTGHSLGANPGMPEGWSDGYVYANGARLHYYRAVPAPEKPDLLMVHGVTDIGLCWATLAKELQGDYNIVMLDARSHGLSDPIKATDDGDTLIKDVVEASKGLGLKKPILIGHSMGAHTVMHLGAKYPALARAIIMLDPFLSRPGDKGPKGKAGKEGEADAKVVQNRLSVRMNADPKTLVAQNNYRFEDLVATGRRQFPKWDDLDVRYWALSKKQFHGAYSGEAWQVMSALMQIGDSLSKIKVPALILKADASLDRRKSDQAAVKGNDKIQIEHVDDAGHNLHQDQRKVTLKHLTRFLSEL